MVFPPRPKPYKLPKTLSNYDKSSNTNRNRVWNS
jgi:hypothetical protein